MNADGEVGTLPPFKWWLGLEPETELRVFRLLLSEAAAPFEHMTLRTILRVPRSGDRIEVVLGRFEKLQNGHTRFTVLPTGRSAEEEIRDLFRRDLKSLRREDEHFCGASSDPCVHDLTKRERTVVEMLLRGSTSQDIATALHLSVHTVRNHRRNIFRKLRVSSQVELMVRFRPHP